MISSFIFGDLTQEELNELKQAAEAMRRARLQQADGRGDVDGYLQFLDDRQELFGCSSKIARKNPLIIERSFVL